MIASKQQELFAAKRMLIDLMAQKENLVRTNYLSYFKPFEGGQQLFFEKCDYYLRTIFSGNRFGKSTIGTIEDVCWLLGERPFFPEDHVLRYKDIPEHDVKGVVVVENSNKIKKVFTQEGNPAINDRVGKMFKYIPPTKIVRTKKDNNGIVVEIEVRNKVRGRIRTGVVQFITVESYKRSEMAVESEDFDFVHVDEPCPEGMWKGLSRGLIDRGGKAWWLCTPLTEPWMYNTAVEKENTDTKECFLYQGEIHENKTLSAEDKERYFSQLTEEERACREAGIPMALSNSVIYTFINKPAPEGHLLKVLPKDWKDFETPPENYLITSAIDTHPQTPHATLCVAVAPSGDIHVYKERFKKSAIAGDGLVLGNESICSWLKKQPEFYRTHYRLLEPAAFNSDQDNPVSYADKFANEGVNVLKGSKKRTQIISLMIDLFASRKENPDGSFSKTKRKVYIHPTCPVFIKEIKTWYNTKENKPADKDDHMMECFGRLLFFDNFTYRKPWESSASIADTDPYSLNVSNSNFHLENFNLAL